MTVFTDRSRYEFKYWIPIEAIPEIRDYIRPHAHPDPILEKEKNRSYTVRSIYFDTPTLDFYYEKLDGVKVRKKLRIRTYDRQNDSAFLEIKRKYINRIAKERSQFSFLDIEKLINAPDQKALEYDVRDRNARIVSGKFIYNLLKKGLVPTALIVYRREPYIDACHSDIRLTIDSDLRGQFKPDLGDLVHDSDLKPVIKDLAILELKFDDFMPGWMGALLKKFKFRRESISKYCLGIQSCCETLLEKDKE